MPIPATACFIQHELGASRGPAFDLQAGCTGFLYALTTAQQFVATGAAKNALVIGAELLTKFLNWKDRTTCVIFADGAGAAVLSAGEEPYGILSSALHTDGSMADYISMPGGGTRFPPSEATVKEGMHFIRMRGNETFKIAVRSMSDVSNEAVEAAGLSLGDIDLLIPHQANKRISDAVANRLGLDSSRIYVNIDRIGNTSAASIPIALDECVRDDRIHRDDLLLFTAFGAGLTWAANVLRWA
jgi:3-oxoacyl-[acyl-carrier-protein] synthase-3